MDLDSTMDDDLPVITYASAVTLLQSIVPVTEAEPGLLYHEVEPHCSARREAVVQDPASV